MAKTRVQWILDNLDKEVARFKASCNIPLGDDGFTDSLSRIGAQGRCLIRNLQAVVDHAAMLSERLGQPERRRVNHS